MSISRESFKIHTCRICLRTSENNMISLEVNSSWAHTFEYCTGIKVTDNMRAPLLFCDNCGKQLQEFFQFKKTCLQADTLWKNVLHCIPICSVAKLPAVTDNIPDGEYKIFIIRENDSTIIYETLLPEIVEELKIKKDWNIYDEDLCSNYGDELNMIKDENFCRNENKKQCPNKSVDIKNVLTKVKDNYLVPILNKKKRKTIVKKEKMSNTSNHFNQSKSNWGRTKCGLCDYTSTNTEDVRKHVLDHFQRNDLQCQLCNFVGMDTSAMLYHSSDHLPTKRGNRYVCCPICCEKMKGNINLLHHYRSVHLKKNGMWCPVCEKNCKNLSSFKSHLFRHKPHYICDLCNNRYMSRENIIKHLTNHKESIVCDVCGKSVKCMSALKIHQQKHLAASAKPKDEIITSNWTRTECGLCDYKSTNTEDVRKHVLEHLERNDLQCQLCSFVGDDASAMLYHSSDHLPQNNNHFKAECCPICCHTKASTFALLRHYRSVHMKKDGIWCPVCRKEFTYPLSLKKHIKIHKEHYVCDLCKNVYLSKDKIIHHLANHKEKKQIICDVCGKLCSKMFDLKLHRQTHFPPAERTRCPHCVTTFKSERALKEHLKRTHGKKPFVCKICSKAYYAASGLRAHEIWHKDHKPFKCSTCGKCFKSKSNMLGHARIHRLILPFICLLCDKAFPTSSQLKKHKSVHTGVREHTCLYCERSFHEKKQLIDHCMVKHYVKITLDSKSVMKEETDTGCLTVNGKN